MEESWCTPSVNIDAHVHLFGPDTQLRPNPRYLPSYSVTPRDLIDRLSSAGQDGALLVQTSFAAAPDDLFRVQEADPERFRVVASAASLEELEAGWADWSARGVVGVRLNLLGRPAIDLTAPGWQRLAEQMASEGVHLELHAEGGDWDALAEGVRRWPGQVVIDHLGRPRALEPLSELARLEHVWFKVSAPYRWPVRQVAESLLADTIASAGGGRLLWGSDWPHTQFEDSVTYESMVRFRDEELPAVVRERAGGNLAVLLGSRGWC